MKYYIWNFVDNEGRWVNDSIFYNEQGYNTLGIRRKDWDTSPRMRTKECISIDTSMFRPVLLGDSIYTNKTNFKRGTEV